MMKKKQLSVALKNGDNNRKLNFASIISLLICLFGNFIIEKCSLKRKRTFPKGNPGNYAFLSLARAFAFSRKRNSSEISTGSLFVGIIFIHAYKLAELWHTNSCTHSRTVIEAGKHSRTIQSNWTRWDTIRYVSDKIEKHCTIKLFNENKWKR